MAARAFREVLHDQCCEIQKQIWAAYQSDLAAEVAKVKTENARLRSLARLSTSANTSEQLEIDALIRAELELGDESESIGRRRASQVSGESVLTEPESLEKVSSFLDPEDLPMPEVAALLEHHHPVGKEEASSNPVLSAPLNVPLPDQKEDVQRPKTSEQKTLEERPAPAYVNKEHRNSGSVESHLGVSKVPPGSLLPPQSYQTAPIIPSWEDSKRRGDAENRMKSPESVLSSLSTDPLEGLAGAEEEDTMRSRRNSRRRRRSSASDRRLSATMGEDKAVMGNTPPPTPPQNGRRKKSNSFVERKTSEEDGKLEARPKMRASVRRPSLGVPKVRANTIALPGQLRRESFSQAIRRSSVISVTSARGTKTQHKVKKSHGQLAIGKRDPEDEISDDDPSQSDGSESSSSSSATEYVVSHTWMELTSRRRTGQVMMLPGNRRFSRSMLGQPAGIGIGGPAGSGVVGHRKFKAVGRSEQAQRWHERKVLLEPGSRGAFAFEVARLLFLLVDFFLVPLHVFSLDRTSTALMATNYVQIAFWMFDLLMTFQLGFLDTDGKLNMAVQSVARHYVSGRFSIDVLVLVFEFADKMALHLQELTIVAQCLKFFFRLYRLRRVPSLFRALPFFAGSQARKLQFSIALYCFSILLITHWLACAWYVMGQLSLHMDDQSWVETIASAGVGERYLLSFQFSMAMFHGETVQAPQSIFERVYVSAVLFLVFVGNIWLVSTITTAMTHLEILSTRRSSMSGALEKWIRDHKISRELTVKIERSAIKMLDDMEKNAPEANIELLQMISEPLRIEIHYEIHGAVLDTHPFFRCFGLLNPNGIRKICHTAVETRTFAADDLVFCDGDNSHDPKVLFVVSGTLKFFKPDEELDATTEHEVTVRNWISEGFLWVDDWMHLGDLIAKTDCKLLALDVEQVQMLILTSGFALIAKTYAEKWVKYANDSMENEYEITDIGEFDHEIDRIMDETFTDTWLQCKHEYSSRQVVQTPLVDTRLSAIRESLAPRASAANRPSAMVRTASSSSYRRGVSQRLANMAVNPMSKFRQKFVQSVVPTRPPSEGGRASESW